MRWLFSGLTPLSEQSTAPHPRSTNRVARVTKRIVNDGCNTEARRDRVALTQLDNLEGTGFAVGGRGMLFIRAS